MTTQNETNKKPLWLAMEETFLALNVQDISGETKEATIQKIARELDEKGYNVSRYGGNMMQLRWAIDDMLKVGRPMLKDFNDAMDKFTLEDLVAPYSATSKLIDELGNTWKEIKKSDRRSVVIQFVEKKRLDLLIQKAEDMEGDGGIRYLIEQSVAGDVITNALDITQEKLDQVNADIEKEKAERARVTTLLEKVADKSNDEKVRHLIENNVSEALILEMAQVDQSAIESVKQAMQAELEEKKRLEEEEAARKKAEAEGPALEDIPADKMADYIWEIRDILEFSDEEKEIRFMCEQSSIPKCLVDIAVSDPDRLDELEKNAEG